MIFLNPAALNVWGTTRATNAFSATLAHQTLTATMHNELLTNFLIILKCKRKQNSSAR